jgi:GH25 family lysozyme M1 (1,4-beta-N-acetylmuramidase)
MSLDITSMEWGPDVSSYRPVKDWRALETSGATFFAAKATEGVHMVDQTFARHSNGIRTIGPAFKMVVYYHFFHAEKSPEDQADNFASAVGELAENERVCCDFEGKSYAAVDPWTIRTHGIEFLDRFYAVLEDRGLLANRGLIYTSAQHWRAIGNPAWSRSSSIDLWVPRYHSPDPKGPDVLPAPWPTWSVLQYTDGDKGIHREVPGIGLCDVNVVSA